ncbi:ABC transporter permease subunit [uncultured Cohaesibacter sp.]|uniref:ABC transporter permease n=1 Tax=uncultured Cohaesibacter sp. TaxID=1002546 RepID=UPI00292DE46E|nr:ABC transporter permease subunit [uncultured Cohaesibacter sp.]
MSASGRISGPFLKRSLFFVAGVALIILLWELGHRRYGDLVLPGVAETFATLGQMIKSGEVGEALVQTAFNAITGWFFSVGLGVVLGGIAGLWDDFRFMVRPVSVMLLGVPAIAWVVLALLWFGGRWAVVFTVVVATAPIIFASAAQGVRSLDNDLAHMARLFRAPTGSMIVDIYGPHMLHHIYPALATTLAMSWKVSIMAELLSGSGGIGDGIAAARARVDTAQMIAWILVVIFILLLLDQVLLRLVRQWLIVPGAKGADNEQA